jgi:hypothetical protein
MFLGHVRLRFENRIFANKLANNAFGRVAVGRPAPFQMDKASRR